MAQHDWKTRAELEAMPEVAEFLDGRMPDYGCMRCGALRTLGEGEKLPDEGCLDLEGALP